MVTEWTLNHRAIPRSGSARPSRAHLSALLQTGESRGISRSWDLIAGGSGTADFIEKRFGLRSPRERFRGGSTKERLRKAMANPPA